MAQHILNNYAASLLLSFLAVLGFIWAVQKQYFNSRPETHWIKRPWVHLLISALVALPSGILSANVASKSTREALTVELSKFRQDLLVKIADTENSWAKQGYMATWPRDVPWPLLVEERQFSKWLVEYRDMHGRILRHFAPGTIKSCNDVLSLLDRPHVASFTIEPETGNQCKMTVAHSFSAAELELLSSGLDQCAQSMAKQTGIFANPWQ